MISLGFSPCPNDTFVFHALVHGLVPGPAFAPPVYADIDVLNAHALAGDLDVVKVSYGVLPRLRGYRLLSSGGALGRGCGPLVVTRTGDTDLRGARVAVPGEQTTAYLLLRLWDPGFGDVTVLPFDRIMPAVRDGAVDAGLVIHEARFTYPSYGLHAVADLGDWWEAETGLPIPLGAIVAREGLDPAAIEAAIRASVEHAWAHPEASRDYVLAHSQELAPEVVDAHIALYVNEFTRDLGDEGRLAVETLLRKYDELARERAG
ncbi:MAG TPA: 1,4-dihydroxy-6-naphthoate synthase [Frankiaceae bacterium]|nr:1,4-dihydroxy-6-naphthoate synthase [Frankiaceae bacterium]